MMNDNQPISQSANQPTFYDSYDWSFLYRRLEMLKQVGKRGKRSRKVKFDTRCISSNELIADKKFPHKFVVNFIASD